jgi:hypothetical protein
MSNALDLDNAYAPQELIDDAIISNTNSKSVIASHELFRSLWKRIFGQRVDRGQDARDFAFCNPAEVLFRGAPKLNPTGSHPSSG